MPKNYIGAWRAMSQLAQAAIGTAQTANVRLPFVGDMIEPEPNQLYVNSDEVVGELAPTSHRLLNMKLMAKHKSKAFPHLVGLFASMAMGGDTSTVVGVTDVYRHKIEIDKTIVELPTRTMVENDGYQQFRYKGVACVGFQLSGQRDGFVEFEADLVGSASEESGDATAKPAVSAESYLTYGDCKLYKGGAFDGSAVAGATEISTKVQSFTAGFKNNGKAVYPLGNSTGTAGSIRRGNRYTYDLKAKLEMEDASDRTALLAGTEFVMHVPIVGGIADDAEHFKVELVYPRVFYKGAKKGQDDGTLIVDGDFEVLADATYGPFVLFVNNLYAADYLAAA